MLDLRESLPIFIFYDHASGLMTAALPNGARIPFDGRDIPGRLGNALALFRKQTIAMNSGRYTQARGAKGELVYSYDESQVVHYHRGRASLPEIELQLEDLDL